MLRRLKAILKLLKGIEIPVGKTFIQKGIYFLQEGLREDLGYKFKLYIYGPYSHDLAFDIDTLQDMGLIKVDYASNKYGYHIQLTPEGEDFLHSYNLQEPPIPQEKIDRIISLLGGEKAKNMELLGTLLYFSRLSSDYKEIEKLVNRVKPHFSSEEIKDGWKLLREERIV